jgi:hypothetical protein
MLVAMDEQFVTITTYEMEPVESITVPAHYSIDEICEAIQSEMTKRGYGQTAQGDDVSTIIIASGGFDSHLHPPT